MGLTHPAVQCIRCFISAWIQQPKSESKHWPPSSTCAWNTWCTEQCHVHSHGAMVRLAYCQFNLYPFTLKSNRVDRNRQLEFTLSPECACRGCWIVAFCIIPCCWPLISLLCIVLAEDQRYIPSGVITLLNITVWVRIFYMAGMKVVMPVMAWTS
jgi:hypothetical protein